MKARHYILFLGLCAAVLLLAGCSDDDGDGARATDIRLANTQLTFSLPTRIVGEKAKQSHAPTRMTADMVQQSQDVAGFRGLEDLHILCFNSRPSASSRKLGNALVLPTIMPSALLGPTQTNHSIYHESVPVGTQWVTVYGHAINGNVGHAATSTADRKRYGVLEAKGLSESDYGTNADITFSPVPICPSEDALGNSRTGQALLALLNDLLNTTSNEEAPENQWATTTNEVLQHTYEAMTSLTTSSSFNVEVMLNQIYKNLQQVADGATGAQLAARLRESILGCCTQTTVDGRDTLMLKAAYQGFPADLNLPSGAARVVWNTAQHRYEFPDYQAYGKELNIPALNTYVYPADLRYQVASPIVASDTLKSADYTKYETWKQVIDSLYQYAESAVGDSTRSIAIVNQLQYAVGRLDSRIMMESGTYYDAKGQRVDVSNGFTLKGYIIGGQHSVDYAFKPLANTTEYYIYDTQIHGGAQHIKPNNIWTAYNYTLGLETPSDIATYMALELINEGPAFQGADGVIAHGATFYLVADLSPRSGTNYQRGVLDQIFRKDYATKVNLSILKGWPDKDGDGIPDPDLDDEGNLKPIQGLATATYGLPDLQPETTTITVGVSVDLTWEQGFVFNDVPL